MSQAFILTLAVSTKPLDKFIVGDVLATVQSKDKTWLSPDIALDIAVDAPTDAAAFLYPIRKICDPHKIDVFLTPAKNRRKKLLIADMDSTIVSGETLDDLAGAVGIKEQIAAITARAMNGELDFRAALEERIALLKDLPVSAIDDAVADLKLNEGADALVKTMKNHGATCYLVSGGFTHFTSVIAARLGFDGHFGNTFEIANDKLTGKVVYPIQDKHKKVDVLHDRAKEHGYDLSCAMTIGDGANDLPMLKVAQEEGGLGIGYFAKPHVTGQILNTIRFGSLFSALYAQGYKDGEIV